jgi:hypothetical protein
MMRLLTQRIRCGPTSGGFEGYNHNNGTTTTTTNDKTIQQKRRDYHQRYRNDCVTLTLHKINVRKIMVKIGHGGY